MNIGGWIFMVASLSFVVGLLAWCFRRVFTEPAQSDSNQDDCKPLGL
jgi:hypothetical protein